jgi:hypothetical protein
LKPDLQELIRKLLNEALSFQNPVARVVYKDVVIQSIHNKEFRALVEAAMRRRNVPITKIKTLFGVGNAAPARAGFDVLD